MLPRDLGLTCRSRTDFLRVSLPELTRWESETTIRCGHLAWWYDVGPILVPEAAVPIGVIPLL